MSQIKTCTGTQLLDGTSTEEMTEKSDCWCSFDQNVCQKINLKLIEEVIKKEAGE